MSSSTTAGLTLFNGVTAVTLTFDGVAALAPQAQLFDRPGAARRRHDHGDVHRTASPST